MYRENLTVYDSITRYMSVKKGVLSPATLGEEGIPDLQKRYFKGTLGLAHHFLTYTIRMCSYG